jgi:hypothetical protein
MMGTLHEDQHTLTFASHWILLRMRNVSEESFKKNKKKTYFILKNFLPKIVPFVKQCGKIL